MQHKPIDLNMATPVLPVLRIDGVRGDAARSPRLALCMIPAVDVSVSNAIYPPLTLHTISKSLHKAAVMGIAVLSASRPRALRLVRSVSSRAFFRVAMAPKIRAIRVICGNPRFKQPTPSTIAIGDIRLRFKTFKAKKKKCERHCASPRLSSESHSF